MTEVINIPIYNTALIITTDKTNLQEQGIRNVEQQEGFVFTCKDEDGVDGIGLFLNDEYDSGVIAHEAFHISNVIFKWIGYKPYEEQKGYDEPQAYLIQYLVDIIEETLEKQ